MLRICTSVWLYLQSLYSRSDVKDMHISMAISAVFEFGEDEGKGLLMGRRILGSLPLVFCCIAVSSLGHTGLLNLG
ncbi:unnamed protein product [Musa acuminata var. zebrina]